MVFSRDDLERNWCWIACDKDLKLAILQSLGDGALLPKFTRSIDDAETVHNYVLDHLLDELSGFCRAKASDVVRSIAVRAPGITGDPDEANRRFELGILRYASCGLFVYDAELTSNFPVGYIRMG